MRGGSGSLVCYKNPTPLNNVDENALIDEHGMYGDGGFTDVSPDVDAFGDDGQYGGR